MIPIKQILQASIHRLGAENYKEFLLEQISRYWNTLVDKSISAFVTPIEIEHDTLFVDVKSSAHKDQLKFFVEEIIDAVNENFGNGEEIIREIRIARPYQIAVFNAKHIYSASAVEENSPTSKKPTSDKAKKFSFPHEETPKVNLEEISLSNEEMNRCRESVKKIENADVRGVALRSLIAQAKFQKFQLENGWHKCKNCDSLCAATETFCEVCRLKEHKKLLRLLFGIFYDTPWLSSSDVQKIFVEKFPNLRDKCSIELVNSARTSLVQNLAGRLTRDEEDENSNEILRLVMLERQITPDKLTPAIVRRTLGELQFNFADPIRYSRYRFTKFRNVQRK